MSGTKMLMPSHPIVSGASRTLLLACVLSAAAALDVSADNVCVKRGSASITLDGVVAGGATTGTCPTVDAVWTGTTPVALLVTGAAPGAEALTGFMYLAVRDLAGTANDRLYIGIDVSGDEDLSDQDAVIIIFDADNSNSWTDGDFYIRIAVLPSGKIESGTACNQSAGNKSYFRRVGGAWQELVGVPAVIDAIEARIAYDYDDTPGDPGDIWNLEISIPMGLTVDGTSYFGLSADAPFRIGAYVFVNDGAQQDLTGYVMEWPATMVDRLFDQQNLNFVPQSQASELANALLEDVCFDVNFTQATHPWMINGSAAAEGQTHISPTGSNTFRVTFYFDGPGANPGPASNTGNVILRLTPYHAGGSGPVWQLPTQSVTVNTFNQEAPPVDFVVNFSDPSAPNRPAGWPASISFICATMILEGFARDDDTGNNSKTVNHNKFTASMYAHSVVVGTHDLPGLRPGESATILLRFDERNGMGGSGSARGGGGAGQLRFGGRSEGFPPTGVAAVLTVGLLALLLVMLQRRRPMRVRAAGAAVVAACGLALYGCPGPQILQPRQQGVEWRIRNAQQLGLERVPGRVGWYQMQIPFASSRQIELEFNGQSLPYQTDSMRLAPAMADGQPGMLRIPVRPGEVRTVVANGMIDLDGPNGPMSPTAATGFARPEGAAAVQRQNYLLRGGRHVPQAYAGALIGSFDGFETSFLVGTEASIVVPAGASALSLAVNAQVGLYQQITGAYDIFTLATPLERVPAHTRMAGDGTFTSPIVLPLWQALASLNIYTFHETTRRDGAGAVISRTRHPWGAAHYSIYAVHAEQPSGVRLRR